MFQSCLEVSKNVVYKKIVLKIYKYRILFGIINYTSIVDMSVEKSQNTEEDYCVNKKDAIKRSLDYYYQNKEKLSQKISCPCLGRYSYKNKA